MTTAADTPDLVDWREHREVLSKFGTDLRQSFRTMSVECGIGKLEAKILMNHKVDQDVHDGYAPPRSSASTCTSARLG
jgi:hypothetical protein